MNRGVSIPDLPSRWRQPHSSEEPATRLARLELRRRRWRTRTAALALAVLLMGAGGAILGRLALSMWQSRTVGYSLVREEQGLIAASSRAGARATLAHRAALTYQGHALRGLLEIPRIDLTAPVLDGASEATLRVAVGHVPQSAWPGEGSGTAVFAAHNVTWFAHIPRLRRGDLVRFVTPHAVFSYRVVAASVEPVDTYLHLDRHGLILDTCYPLNALYFTGQRYLVYADFCGSRVTGTVKPRATPALPAQPRLSLPTALVRQGLTLRANPIPLGALLLAGSPDVRFSQSPATLDLAAAAHELFFAALHAAEQQRTAWWRRLAPQVPFSRVAPLCGARLAAFPAPLDTVLTIQGQRLVCIDLTLRAEVAGGPSPGTYALHVREAARRGMLRVTGCSLSPTTVP